MNTMKPEPELIERLFDAARRETARGGSIHPPSEAPESLSRNILREIRLIKPRGNQNNMAHSWETLSTAAVSVGALIAIACTIAGRTNEPIDGIFNEPNFIANEFIQQSIEP